MKDQELKTAVFSDTHGQWKTMFSRAQEAGCIRILHCGDMDFLIEGTEKELQYFPTPQKYKVGYRDGTKPVELKDYLSGVPVETYAIYGNHEGFSHFYKMQEGPYEILPGLNIFGRYGQIELETGVGKLKVAGLSGVYSEKYSHEYNYDGTPYRWSPKNKRDCSPKNAAYLHEKDVNHIALTYTDIDILLLHENPLGRHDGRSYGYQIINDLIEMLEPKLVFCGHMHFADRRQIGNSTIINIPKNDFVILEELWRDLQ